jgi:hypothetical protein
LLKVPVKLCHGAATVSPQLVSCGWLCVHITAAAAAAAAAAATAATAAVANYCYLIYDFEHLLQLLSPVQRQACFRVLQQISRRSEMQR